MGKILLNYSVTTPPAEEPVSLDEAKLQCRVDAGMTDDDALISALIVAARDLCEAKLSRAFVTRDYELRLDRFPNALPITHYPFLMLERLPDQLAGTIFVPRPPLASVNSIAYLDNSGTLQSLAAPAYLVESGGALQGRIAPAYGTTWPATRHQMGAVVIGITAGYGDAAAVPAGIKAAMKLCIGHWYRNREAVAPGPMAEVPLAVDALLAPHEWGGYA